LVAGPSGAEPPMRAPTRRAQRTPTVESHPHSSPFGPSPSLAAMGGCADTRTPTRETASRRHRTWREAVSLALRQRAALGAMCFVGSPRRRPLNVAAHASQPQRRGRPGAVPFGRPPGGEGYVPCAVPVAPASQSGRISDHPKVARCEAKAKRTPCRNAVPRGPLLARGGVDRPLCCSQRSRPAPGSLGLRRKPFEGVVVQG